MTVVGGLQFIVFLTLAVVVFVAQLFALIDAARRPGQAYTSEGKLSKPIWLAILGVAAALGFLGLPPFMLTTYSFLNLLAVIPAIVYWVDVRPRIKPYGPRRGGSSGGSYGGSGGW